MKFLSRWVVFGVAVLAIAWLTSIAFATGITTPEPKIAAGTAIPIHMKSVFKQTSAAAAMTAKPQMSETVFKNIQVLKGIPVDQFNDTMGMFASALLLDCVGCHDPKITSDPKAFALSTPPTATSNVPAADNQSFKTALAEAFGHRSYVLLVLGFFTCGFQLAFITVHLPAYLVDRGIPTQTGGWVLAAIGLFNIIGSLSVGYVQNYIPKRYILSAIYFTRALSILIFISFPITTFSAIAFGAISGLTWLSTVPPTSALVALMFGTRWFATLYGFAFVSHQVGGFLGVWLGGIVFEKFGSYTPIWWLSILFGVLSALINLPIVEKPVERAVAQPA